MEEKKSFPKIEEEIMKKWKREETFKKSVEQRSADNSYVFYDGPPFATGLPHYGHLVASAMKDIVPRFWTMRGRRVERRWGWDCHGLPIENIVEKELNLKSRKDIEALGVDKFNETCRSKVLMYADEWKKIIERLGRWVDMDNDYKTMDADFMESVWWVFKSLWENGLLYEGYKSMHICPRCEATLSNIEVSLNYKDIEDIGVVCKFELAGEPGTFVLAWTTTPWTLPGNVALAVGEKLTYVKVKIGAERFILLKDLIPKVLTGRDYKIEAEFKGKALEEKKYRPLFDYFVDAKLSNKENLYKIVTADFVSTEEGTGVVHIAPAFGEDDMLLGQEKKLPLIQHLGLDGRFKPEIKDWQAEEVKPSADSKRTDKKIVEFLKQKGLVFDSAPYTHSYPHCWRCETPLLNYSTSSWFVNVLKIKNQMLKLAKKINWMPKHLKEGRFGQWLEGARDWAISRTRYWGNPMPVWRCDCGETRVVGSRQELEELSGQQITDLHKHFVDKIKLPCAKCGGQMSRVPEVLDCWFESASMPYGQMHYPFENQKKFEDNFPAEFIAEGVDQCRCWFYVLHVLSVALFKKPAYKNVVVNGIVLAEDGQKMSKSKNNYPDPMLVVEKYGADALRYYLTVSGVMRAEDLCFSEKGVDEVYKKIILIALNVLNFYKMFSNEQPAMKSVSDNILDQWILAKLNALISEMTRHLEDYDLPRAGKLIADFMDDLSTWYLRRSRDRFKSNVQAEREQALLTLKEALEKLALVSAPFMPYLAEHLWQEIGNKGSVHLQNWPGFDDELIDEKVLEKMQAARRIVELALAARDEAGVKIRQPLSALNYNVSGLGAEYEQIIADELNVLKVGYVKEIAESGDVKKKEMGNISVGLNVAMNDKLRQLGLLRELTRQINHLRKEVGLTINDRVKIIYQTDSSEIKSLLSDKELALKLRQATLATEIEAGEGENSVKVNDIEVKVTFKK
ncbi:isoleucine--tRNA ligase [Candidatus Falkowbacteria bacterium]|nr:isoleucine--tRNA ligase [Candidatus Falkowbacteria bacterium]